MRYLIIGFSLLFMGCSGGRLEVKTESLTGEKSLVATHRLIPQKNCEEGELILKHAQKEKLNYSKTKGILKIAHMGMDYAINPHEELSLFVDGVRYPLSIINSVKTPKEETKTNNIYLPSGRVIPYGTVKEVTRRKISFFLSQEVLSKICDAKTAYFEIDVPTRGNETSLEGYPIVLDINLENVELIQKYRNLCANNNQLNQE